jgi:hypothetical protein
MRTLVIWFIFWIFIVPSLVGSFLILVFIATVAPPLYFALAWFVLAFSTAFLLLGPSCVISLAPFARSRFGSSQCSCHKTNPSQEKNNESHHKIKVFFE